MSVPPPPYDSGQPYPPPYGSDQPYPPPAGSYGAPPPPGPYGAPPPYGAINPYAHPGAPYGVDQYGQPLSDKSKLVAGLLSLFLGTFGVGRFYLGHTGLGVAMLLAAWLTCGIWPLIDTIMIFMGNVKDGQGRTLRE